MDNVKTEETNSEDEGDPTLDQDWCDECQGRGKVTTADYESYFGADYKPCPKCGGDPCVGSDATGALASGNCCAFAPLHPARLAHPLEGTLRRDWEKYISERPGFDVLCGPEVHFLDVPPGVEADENKLNGGYQPYPHGRMTERDKMLAAELIQWLGSPLGFAFLSTAFERAGGRVMFDDYKHNNEVSESARKPT